MNNNQYIHQKKQASWRVKEYDQEPSSAIPNPPPPFNTHSRKYYDEANSKTLLLLTSLNFRGSKIRGGILRGLMASQLGRGTIKKCLSIRKVLV